MSQKFPHINITPAGATSASPGSSKPLLTVKPNSQLPGVSGVNKSQANIVAAGKVNVGNSKASITAIPKYRVQSLGKNTVTTQGRQVIVKGPDREAARSIAKMLASKEAKLGNVKGKQVLLVPFQSRPAPAPAPASAPAE